MKLPLQKKVVQVAAKADVDAVELEVSLVQVVAVDTLVAQVVEEDSPAVLAEVDSLVALADQVVADTLAVPVEVALVDQAAVVVLVQKAKAEIVHVVNVNLSVETAKDHKLKLSK